MKNKNIYINFVKCSTPSIMKKFKGVNDFLVGTSNIFIVYKNEDKNKLELLLSLYKYILDKKYNIKSTFHNNFLILDLDFISIDYPETLASTLDITKNMYNIVNKFKFLGNPLFKINKIIRKYKFKKLNKTWRKCFYDINRCKDSNDIKEVCNNIYDFLINIINDDIITNYIKEFDLSTEYKNYLNNIINNLENYISISFEFLSYINDCDDSFEYGNDYKDILNNDFAIDEFKLEKSDKFLYEGVYKIKNFDINDYIIIRHYNGILFNFVSIFLDTNFNTDLEIALDKDKNAYLRVRIYENNKNVNDNLKIFFNYKMNDNIENIPDQIKYETADSIELLFNSFKRNSYINNNYNNLKEYLDSYTPSDISNIYYNILSNLDNPISYTIYYNNEDEYKTFYNKNEDLFKLKNN